MNAKHFFFLLLATLILQPAHDVETTWYGRCNDVKTLKTTSQKRCSIGDLLILIIWRHFKVLQVPSQLTFKKLAAAILQFSFFIHRANTSANRLLVYCIKQTNIDGTAWHSILRHTSLLKEVQTSYKNNGDFIAPAN